MVWQWTPYMIPLIVGGVALVMAALYTWRRHRSPMGVTAALVLLAIAEWTLGYALELGSVDLASKVFWDRVQFVGIVVTPTAWLAFVLQYTGREHWLRRRTLVLLAVVPLITLLLVFTNEAHGLVWSRVWLDTDAPFVASGKTRGVWFWAFVIYSYMLLLLASFLLAQMLMRSRRFYRWQGIALLFSALVPGLVNVVDLFGLNPFPYFQLTSLGFTVSGLILAWRLSALQRGDIVSVSRRVILESLGDAVIVLNPENRVVDLNPAAQHLIGHTASEVMGQPMEQAWPEWRSQMEHPCDGTEISKEMALGEGDRQHTYDVRISSLLDWRDRLTFQVVVLRDITERVRAEEALRDSERSYRLLAENVTDVIWTMDTNGRYTYFSPSITRLRGYSAEEAMAQTTEEILTPASLEVAMKVLAEELAAEQMEPKDLSRSRTLELELKCKDGSTVWTEVKTTDLRGPDGRPVGILGVTRDITERKRAEEQIRASLREKEVLLKEIHHRVKNNLQVMSSLLYLQSKNIKDIETLEMFQDSQSRVRSMALVHEKLYQSQDLARIDFAEYVRSLASYLFRSYGVNANVIRLKISVDDVFLGVDTAIPCGLIINELVSNCLKHAFPGGRVGEIHIELRVDDEGQFALMISDNGIGFPKELDFRDTGSLGLQLVNTLVGQLESTIELDRSVGTKFKITFTEYHRGAQK